MNTTGAEPGTTSATTAPPVRAESLTLAFGDKLVQRDLGFDIRAGEVFGIAGGSGCGKSTLLRHLVGLQAPAAGRVLHGGHDLYASDDTTVDALRRRSGVMFQAGALWSSMTVGENVMLPLELFTSATAAAREQTARDKLALVGLAEAFDTEPAALSGGMKKRAAIARAMALDPALLFLDEPSAGLDPLTSAQLDALILHLRGELGTTIVMVSHELESLFAVADRLLFLDAETKTMTALGPPRELLAHGPDGVRLFLNRGRRPAKRKANATLIGAFVVAGLALLVLAIVTLAGSKLFTRKERAVMHFSGSVYGLQVGAPVVFRGVRVGSVESIEVFYDRATDTFSIPVVAELDGDVVRGLDGRSAANDVALALPALVKRGLTAQLAQQSFLTGLLYVDLDLRPLRSGSLRGTYRGAPEIPTSATAIQALKNQLDGMDFRRITEDLSAIAASARALVAGSGPQLKQVLDDLAQIAASVRRVSARLDKRVDPLADDMQRSLAALRNALARVGRAADGVDSSAGRLGQASDRVGALVAPDAPLVAKLQRAVDEVARSAAALRQSAGGDSTLVVGTTRAMQDLSNAARALRDLAETLEQQPESLLRGRKVAP